MSSTPGPQRPASDFRTTGAKVAQPAIEGLTPSQRILLEDAQRRKEAVTESKKAASTRESGLRGVINRHPAWSIGTIAIFLAAFLYFEYRPPPPHKAFYTVDDGQTTFTHEYVVPPFDSGGKEAVQAVMFVCEHGNGPFVGYLIRFSPDAKKKLESDLKAAAGAKARGPVDMSGAEVKKPGSGVWVSNVDPRQMGKKIAEAMQSGQDLRNSMSAGEIMNVRCPDGKMAIPAGGD